MSSNETLHLFVYGTLQKDFGHPMFSYVEHYARFVSRAYTLGKLYDIGRFPGLVSSKNAEEKVWGEVYEIVDQENLFIFLDDYEGCTDADPQPHRYRRELCDVHLTDRMFGQAWTYCYQWPVDDKNQIKGGSYLSFLGVKQPG